MRHEERAQQIRLHDVDLHPRLIAAESIAADNPPSVPLRLLAQVDQVARDRLERHDQSSVTDALAKKPIVLAAIGADVQHALDVELVEEVRQVKTQRALLQIAARHDLVAEPAHDPADRPLDGPPHREGRVRRRASQARACGHTRTIFTNTTSKATAQTRNNARAVYTDGVVDDRYHRKREKCKYRIEPDRNGEHCCEGDETLK